MIFPGQDNAGKGIRLSGCWSRWTLYAEREIRDKFCSGLGRPLFLENKLTTARFILYY